MMFTSAGNLEFNQPYNNDSQIVKLWGQFLPIHIQFPGRFVKISSIQS